MWTKLIADEKEFKKLTQPRAMRGAMRVCSLGRSQEGVMKWNNLSESWSICLPNGDKAAIPGQGWRRGSPMGHKQASPAISRGDDRTATMCVQIFWIQAPWYLSSGWTFILWIIITKVKGEQDNMKCKLTGIHGPVKCRLVDVLL